jgi:hypothetical protein
MAMDHQSGMSNKSPSADRHGVSTKGAGLKQGKDRSPKFPDSSMGCKGGSVNSGPTRSEVGKTPGTLGPRTA